MVSVSEGDKLYKSFISKASLFEMTTPLGDSRWKQVRNSGSLFSLFSGFKREILRYSAI